MRYQISDYLLSAVAYGGMGIAVIIGRGILLGLSEDISALFKRKPPPIAKTTVPWRAARSRPRHCA